MRVKTVLATAMATVFASAAFFSVAASPALAASVTLKNGATTAMNVGDKGQTDSLHFRYGANVKVTWESTNTSVASLGYESVGFAMVSSPFGSGSYETHSMDVYAKYPGTATITATTKAGVQGTYNIVVNKVKEAIPNPANSRFTYTGSTVTFMSSSAHYTVTGASATNAGTYTATATLNDTGMYEWSDGTTAPKTFSWTIDKANVDIPQAATGLVYDGTELTGIEESGLYKLSGDYSATRAGVYTAQVALADPSNFTWSDGTSDDKVIQWNVAKAPNTMKAKLKKSTLKQSYAKKQSTSVRVSKAFGKVSYKSSSKKVKVSKNGNVTVAKGYKGSVRITVAAAGDGNHKDSKAVLRLRVA